MKLTRGLLALALTFSLSLFSFLTLSTHTAIAQEINAALREDTVRATRTVIWRGTVM